MNSVWWMRLVYAVFVPYCLLFSYYLFRLNEEKKASNSNHGSGSSNNTNNSIFVCAPQNKTAINLLFIVLDDGHKPMCDNLFSKSRFLFMCRRLFRVDVRQWPYSITLTQYVCVDFEWQDECGQMRTNAHNLHVHRSSTTRLFYAHIMKIKCNKMGSERARQVNVDIVTLVSVSIIAYVFEFRARCK